MGNSGTCLVVPGGEVDRSAATVEALICFQLSGLFANWFVTSVGFGWQRNTCLDLYILGHHSRGSSLVGSLRLLVSAGSATLAYICTSLEEEVHEHTKPHAKSLRSHAAVQRIHWKSQGILTNMCNEARQKSLRFRLHSLAQLGFNQIPHKYHTDWHQRTVKQKLFRV